MERCCWRGVIQLAWVAEVGDWCLVFTLEVALGLNDHVIDLIVVGLLETIVVELMSLVVLIRKMVCIDDLCMIDWNI